MVREIGEDDSMRIFIMGAGRMGAWLVEELCIDHEVAVYDTDRRKLKYFFDVNRFREHVQKAPGGCERAPFTG